MDSVKALSVICGISMQQREKNVEILSSNCTECSNIAINERDS